MSSPVSPLSLNQLTRDTWGAFDPAAIAQVASLAEDDCYTPKFYKAPQGGQALFNPYDFQAYGLQITPGSVIYGVALGCAPGDQLLDGTQVPPAFTVQITDVGLKRKWFDEPLGSLFLANYKPTGELIYPVPGEPAGWAPSFYNLLNAPYPVVEPGLFMVEMTETAGLLIRLQLIFAVLEVCKPL